MFPRGFKGRVNSLADALLPLRSWINVSGECIYLRFYITSMTSGHVNSWSIVYSASSSANINRYSCQMRENVTLSATFPLKENCVIMIQCYNRIESTFDIIPAWCCWRDQKFMRLDNVHQNINKHTKCSRNIHIK